MSLGKHKRDENVISSQLKNSVLPPTKEELKQIIIDKIKELFSPEEGIENDLSIPINWNCDDFNAEILMEELEKDGLKVINIDQCDSIEDIILNNFNY